MKALNYYELDMLSCEINDKIRGNHLTNITVISSTDILISFSFYRAEKMLISINHNAPFISLIEPSLTVPSLLVSLTEELRKNIRDTIVEEVRSIDKERIIELKLIKTDEFFVQHHFSMFLELIPTHPNLVILDENGKIVYATHYTSLDAKRIIIKGMKYELPLNTFNNEIVLIENLNQFKEDVSNYLPSLINKRLKEKYGSLFTSMNQKIKKCKNKIKVLNEEIEEATKKLIYQEYGTMILSLMYDENELTKYLLENHIPYDEKLSPTDNANKLFKLYKKAKQTLQIDKEQLDANDEQIKELENDLSSLDGADESLYILLSNKYLKVKVAKQEINKLTPYYVTIEGTKIGFGRNAQQNDLLTFKKASTDYYFLHLENVHANHIVIMKNNPTDRDKQLAAELCLALQNKEAGNVQIAQIKDIKKGKAPGQVLLSKYTVIKINNVSNKVRNTLEKAKRISF